MSHTVKLQVEIKDRSALLAACERLGYRVGEEGMHAFYYKNEPQQGLAIYLPGWSYPVVIKGDGTIAYDNYNGSWGDIGHLNKLRQIYAAEVTQREFAMQGLSVYEQTNQDGSMTLTVETGG